MTHEELLIVINVVRILTFAGFGGVLLTSIYKFKKLVFTLFGLLMFLNLASLYVVMFYCGKM